MLAIASLKGETKHSVLIAVSAILYALCASLFATVHPLF
jgi:hypothetical protein